MLQFLQTYLRELALKRANASSTSELSLRDALSDLLKDSAKHLKSRVEFVPEPKKVASGLRPDYTVTRAGLQVGYIEAEKPDADLDNLAGHAKTQNEQLIAGLGNFLLTNHYDFRVFENQKLARSLALPQKAEELTPEHAAQWESLFLPFVQADFAPIKNPADLAKVLSHRARLLRFNIAEELEDKGSYSSGAFHQFKSVLLPNLEAGEFADIYAQTLVYGLFAAAILAPDPAALTTDGAARGLRAIPLIATFFNQFQFELPDNLRWVLEEMVAVLKRSPLDEIKAYFQKRQGRADPMIDFYEPFLAAFDPAKRESRGVYYTPESVVGYLVRSTDALLKRDFGRELGSDGCFAQSGLCNNIRSNHDFSQFLPQSVFCGDSLKGMKEPSLTHTLLSTK